MAAYDHAKRSVSGAVHPGLKPGPMLMIETPHLFWFIVGSLTLANSFLLIFDVLGYLLKVYGYQVGPVILGMILGPMMDKSYRQAMISAEENVGQFAAGVVTSPLSAIILVAQTLTIASQTRWWKRIPGKARMADGAEKNRRG